MFGTVWVGLRIVRWIFIFFWVDDGGVCVLDFKAGFDSVNDSRRILTVCTVDR